jgi:3-oxoadipate enol-lactonase
VPTVRINDIGIDYELRGEGDPLVLIGGPPSDVTAFGNVIEGLAVRCRVLACHHQGGGRGGKPDAHRSIEMMADDTAGLMDAVGVEEAHILGISTGAGIGLALALAHPERVKGLIRVSAGACTPAGLTPSAPVRVARRLRSLPLPGRDFRKRRASGGYDPRGRLGEIHTPTLILRGRRDTTVPRRQVEELHDGIGGSQLVTFDGGHRFFLTRERGEFLERVAAFVSGHR